MTQIFHSLFVKEGEIKLVCLLLSITLWGFVKSLKISTVKINVSLHSENMPEKMILTSRLPKFVTLHLRGEKENLRFPTSNLKAILDLSSIKSGLNVLTPYFDKSLLPNRVDLKSISEIRILCEKMIQKKLWVKFALKGKPKRGYQVGQVVAVPNRITVSGPVSQLKNIYRVDTQKINVENLHNDFKKVVLLVAPNHFISFVNDDRVNISARVFQVSAKNKKILENVPIDILKLNPNYNIVLHQKKVSIHLEGNPEFLEEISIEDLNAFINLDNIIIPEIEADDNEEENEGNEGNKENKTNEKSSVMPLSIPVEVSLIRFKNKVFVVQVKPSELRASLSKKKVNEALPLLGEKQLVPQ